MVLARGLREEIGTFKLVRAGRMPGYTVYHRASESESAIGSAVTRIRGCYFQSNSLLSTTITNQATDTSTSSSSTGTTTTEEFLLVLVGLEQDFLQAKEEYCL